MIWMPTIIYLCYQIISNNSIGEIVTDMLHTLCKFFYIVNLLDSANLFLPVLHNSNVIAHFLRWLCG